MTTPPESDEAGTWIKYTFQPFITKEQVKAITKKATIKQKLRLLFKPSQYSIDGRCIVRYKKMDGITFVMKRGTHL